MSKSSSCPKHSSTIVIQMQGTPRQGLMLKGLINKLNIKSFWILIFDINYQFTAFVFFIFWLVEEGEVWFEGDSTWLINYKKGSDITNFFPKHNFPFFYYHKINLHLGIYINLWTVFFLCCLKYESFSNCEQ